MYRSMVIWLLSSCLAALAWAADPATVSESTDETRRPRLLLIALDAVPHSIMQRISTGEDGAFKEFKGPTALISTFPSTTSLALAGILESFGLKKSPGYEHRYFDHQLNRKRGGGIFSYRQHLFPWRKFFDWQSEGVVKKGILLLRPQKGGKKSIDKSLAAFAASDQQVFTIYHDLTDLIGHVKGPDDLEQLLRHLDTSLRSLRQRPGMEPFRTVIYSDHGLSGGEPLRNVRKTVKRALRRSGHQITGKIRRPEDVVFIPYGLVSSFVAFTTPERAVSVARTIARVEGVDLCVASTDAGWRIESSQSSAQVLRREVSQEVHFAYQPLVGDPLGYSALVTDSATPNDGATADASTELAWRSDSWWFEKTKTAAYPDALYRISRGFDLVENPASIICSNSDGYMYGAAYTVFGSRVSTGRLRWTHGALDSEASLGFVMSDLPTWEAPEVTRFDQALTLWSQ